MRLPRRRLDFMSCSARGQPAPYTPCMRISVFGCGYLGAVHAACMASLGHEVVGVDVIEEQVAALAAGRPPFHEPGLEELLAEALATGRLEFTTDPARAADAVVHFICVGTPQKRNENAADLTYVRSAVDSILPLLKPGDVVVGKSTVPVGTAESVADRIEEREPGRRAGLEPGVPPRGPRGRGHDAPRPAGLRLPRRRGRHAGGGRPRRGVRRRAGRRHPQDRDRPGHRPAGEGGRQLVPGHQDLLHQRDGRAVRGHRRRRDPAGRRDRPRRADRPQVPQRRRRASAAAACPRTSAPSWRAPASSAPTRR